MQEPKTDIKLMFGPADLHIELEGHITEESLKNISANIIQQLKVQKVVALPTAAELDHTLRQALQVQGQDLKNVIVARGTEPTPAKDGEIKWTRNFFQDDFLVDEKTGSIDYREKTRHRQVQKGELLCHVTLPAEGVDGKDVFGKPIRAGKPKTPRVIAGQNVRKEKTEEGTLYYAEADGRIRWVSDKLSIDQTYKINGDVDLQTGNIDHSGALVIGKDVKTGSKIAAVGDIQVGGIMEPADIQSQGNLIVHGGITGSEQHKIEVHGSVHAKFIQEATIQAGGDIVVQKEILHSRILTQGNVKVPVGDITGGSIHALGTIEVKQAGGPGLPATLLAVGEDHALAKEIHSREVKIAEIRKSLEKIHFALDPMMSRMKLLNAKQKEAATALLARSYEMEEAAEEMQKEIEELKRVSKERAGKHIIIRGMVYPETTLRISGTNLLVREERKGPLRASVSAGVVLLESMR